MIDVAPGTVVVYADIACPWAHVAVARLHRVRDELGLRDEVRFDHRAFPLELVNERPTPFRVLGAEVPVAGALEPDAGWQVWRAPEWTWPVTSLPALEAVQIAKDQGLEASEQLDRALRKAFFGASECISMRHVILEAAASCPAVDAGAIAEGLDSGAGRAAVVEQHRVAGEGLVKGSPHLFFADGSDAANPGIRLHWVGDHGRGFPVVDADDPGLYRTLLARAAGDAAA